MMPKEWYFNEAGEPMGYDEIPSQYEQEALEYERMYEDDGLETVTCPECGAKLFAEDVWDNDMQCWKCNTKIKL